MTNKTKQTAVEWLVKEYHLPPDSPLVQQAKEMEKEQKMNDFLMGIKNANQMEAKKDSEQWYNETYRGNK